MTTHPSPRTIRRLVAAEGYLDLNLPAYALRELDAIDDVGPFEPHEQYLRGRSLLVAERYEDAIEPLKQAAMTMPAPLNRLAWLSLGYCYRVCGREELAEVVEMFASEPAEPREPPQRPVTVVQIQIVLAPRTTADDSVTDESPSELPPR